MLFDNPGTLDPDEILDWLNVCSISLDKERRQALALMPLGKPLPSHIAVLFSNGATVADVETYFSSAQVELNLAAVLTLAASIEARIRLDANRRCVADPTDLGKRLKFLRNAARTAWGVPFYDEGIMDAWKAFVGTLTSLPQKEIAQLKTHIGNLKDVLNIRHWVAHGRYWELTRGPQAYPPTTVAKVAKDLYKALANAASAGNATTFV